MRQKPLRRTLATVAVFATACGPAASSDSPAETAAPITVAAAPTTTPPPTTTTEPATATPTSSTAVTPTTMVTTTTAITTLPPVFAYSVESVTEEVVWASWREDCPLHFSDLLLLTLTYWDFDGEVATGQLAINSAVAGDVISAFDGLFEIGFPIERLQLVDDYGGDDKAAMAANVTSGFNCRYVDGTDRWSNHAFGLAVDINPLINPWARVDNVLPLEGQAYIDRELDLPGMINLGDQAINVFQEVGWSWGGTWQSADYMHFSKPGN